MKGGKAIIVVGGTGMGKTSFIKGCLSHIHKDNIWLYDVNNEYTDYINPYPIDPISRVPKLPEFKRFCERACTLQENVIVFEEATIFLNNKGSNQMVVDMLVRKRHTQNLIFLAFHSLRSVPKYLLDLCNVLVLHKTTADPDDVVEKFNNPDLLKAFLYIKNAPMIPGKTKMYSPSRLVNLTGENLLPSIQKN